MKKRTWVAATVEITEKRKRKKVTVKYNQIIIIAKEGNVYFHFEQACNFGRMDIETRRRLCSLDFKPKYRKGWVKAE